MTPAENRRVSDAILDKLVLDVASLQVDMKANTEVTVQVRDILSSFRIMAAIAKWLAAIGAGAAALFHGYDFLKKL